MKQVNGNIFIRGQQRKAFAQAKTKKRILELIQKISPVTSIYELKVYWSPIMNDRMKAIAGDQEGVWVTKTRNYHDEEYDKLA